MIGKLKEHFEARSRDETLFDVHRSRRNSTYVLSSGAASGTYIDIDAYYFGNEGDYDFDLQRAQQRLGEVVELVVPEIIAAASEHSITRLAFPEKPDDGPVGTVAMMDLILLASGLEGCVVRPERRLIAARIKGRPIVSGERIMIVSDVATTGGTIARPAACLRELGAVVPAAFVLLDRGQGARERLQREGIELVSFWSISTLNEKLERRLKEVTSN
jgi:orotate phosphoribosyltransferase